MSQIKNKFLAQMSTLTIKGNNTGSTANPQDLTVAQVNAILPVFTSSLNGLAPLSGGGTTNFLRADGTWAAPAYPTLTSLGIRTGQTSISSGATSQAVTFSSTLGTTSYAVTATMVNTTDTNVQFQPITVTAQSATGFTATWNAPTSTANYVLNWHAILNN